MRIVLDFWLTNAGLLEVMGRAQALREEVGAAAAFRNLLVTVHMQVDMANYSLNPRCSLIATNPLLIQAVSSRQAGV